MRRPTQEGMEGSEGPTEGLGEVERTSRMAKRGRESPQEGWRIWRYSRRARSGWEALLECQEGSEGPPRVSGGVGRPSWRAGKGWEAFLDGQEGQMGLGSPLKWPGGPTGGLG